MPDAVFERFLNRQREAAMALAADSDVLELVPERPHAPARYLARFNAPGLAGPGPGELREAPFMEAKIFLPPNYMRQTNSYEVITVLRPRDAWHSNIRMPFVCIDVYPKMPLVDVLDALYRVWTWQLYNTTDGFSDEATAWAFQQPRERFPLSTRPLRRRQVSVEIITEPGVQS